MPSYQPVTLQPNLGGDLITRLSPENVGGANYVIKRDWRRLLDAEIRREGHVKFAPDEDEEDTDQFTVPNEEEITLIHFARKPNGKTATIVGTKTTLYRFFSFEDGRVFTIDVFTSDVYEDRTGLWLEIGTNFSENGNRWEAKDVAGQTVFNNGVDLPVIYDLDWLEVRPLYELREQGIAFAGTIEEFNGALVLGDIAELTEAGFTSVMSGATYSSASQTGYTITATTGAFATTDVGKTVLFNTGEYAKILSRSSSTVVVTDTYQAVALGTFRLASLFGTITDDSLYSRVQYRLLVSNIGDATDFQVIREGAATAGSSTITLTTPTFSIFPGDEVIVGGAGASGAALAATVLNINGARTSIVLDQPAITTITGTTVQRADELDSLTAAFDLQDDGSAIVRISELQGRLVVLKETSIFVGQFTGSADNLIQFQKVYAGSNSIAWKWTLVKIDGVRLLYAGGNKFFTFDLSSIYPKAHDKLILCDNLFYDSANDLTLNNTCWAVDNPVTKEVWVVYPTESEDRVLCYDYQSNTCSTVSVSLTAAGAVKRPQEGVQIGVGEDWFLIGTEDGELFRYGLTNLDTGTWQRDGENYDSLIKSGLLGERDNFDETDLRNYILYISSNPETVISVTLYGARNAHESPVALFTREITAPTYKNLIPTYFRKNYYQDELLVSEVSTNASIVRRVLEFMKVDSRSAVRNNSE